MPTPTETSSAPSSVPSCPKCGGEMWDNREGKRNPKAPDFKCKDRTCDGVIWPPRTAAAGAAPVMAGGGAGATSAPGASSTSSASPSCPICGGPMWDDRASKRNPRAPDFKCKNKPKVRGGPGCEGVIWPPRDGQSSGASTSAARRPAASGGGAGAGGAGSRARPSPPPPSYGDAPPPYDGPPPDDDDLLPF